MASGTVHKQFTRQEILDLIYPLGAVYISLDNTSPALMFGGTWVKISGRFLLATGTCAANSDSYFGSIKAPNTWNPGLGSTGGEDYHTLSVNEMPSHNHAWPAAMLAWAYASDTTLANPQVAPGTGSGNNGGFYTDRFNSATVRGGVVARGGGVQHNNMPPYMAVNMWYRTA